MGLNGSAYWSIYSSFDGTFQFWRIVNGEFQTANINGQGYWTFYGGTNAASDARLSAVRPVDDAEAPAPAKALPRA